MNIYLISYSTKAYNGCLGVLCLRRTYKAAKVVGEEPQSFDPAVSEWGNPRPGNMAEPRYAWNL